MKKTFIVIAVLIGIGALFGNDSSESSYESNVISKEDQLLVNQCVNRGNDYETCYKGYNKLAK
jgi:hypothetical protein